MSTVKLEAVGQTALDRASRLLAGIDGGVGKAVRGAMARAVSHLRANSAKAVRERYAISAANIRGNENVTVQYSYQKGVQASVQFAGKKIPLYRYDGAAPVQPEQDMGKWIPAMIGWERKWVHPSTAARGHQLKSTAPTLFEHAFTARMASGHVGIFERNGEISATGGEAITELMGSSVPQMLGSHEVAEKLGRDSMNKFEERLDHEILRILSGWGA